MKHWPTILLVEDERSDAAIFQETLRANSISAHLQIASDGQAAIEYLQGEGKFSDRQAHPLPGLVVLDLRMPGLGGMGLLEWIRQQPGLHGLPVIVFTGSDEHGSLLEAMKHGADTYIIKGRETRDLIHLLKNADLNWRTSHRAATAGDRSGSVGA